MKNQIKRIKDLLGHDLIPDGQVMLITLQPMVDEIMEKSLNMFVSKNLQSEFCLHEDTGDLCIHIMNLNKDYHHIMPINVLTKDLMAFDEIIELKALSKGMKKHIKEIDSFIAKCKKALGK